MQEHRAKLVIPQWMKKKLDRVSDKERAEIFADVDYIAASMGFPGWDLSIVSSPLVSRTPLKPGAPNRAQRRVNRCSGDGS